MSFRQALAVGYVVTRYNRITSLRLRDRYREWCREHDTPCVRVSFSPFRVGVRVEVNLSATCTARLTDAAQSMLDAILSGIERRAALDPSSGEPHWVSDSWVGTELCRAEDAEAVARLLRDFVRDPDNLVERRVTEVA